MRLSRADKIKVKELSEAHGISFEEVEKIISAPYSLMAKVTKNLNLKQDMSKEEFEKEKTNFNMPGLCKFYASYYLYNKIQEKNRKRLGE